MAWHFKQRLTGVARAVWRHSREVVVLAIIVLAFVVGYGLRGGGEQQPSHDATQSASTEPQWYTCSMHPEVRMPDPNDKCPICFMDLIPVTTSGSASGSGNPRQITLSPEAQALIEVQTVPVTRRFIEHKVNMVGTVAYDETRLAYITAYVAGRLDRMFVDYTGITVRQDDHLAEIYSPDLLVAQEELIEAKRTIDRLGPNNVGLAQETARSILDSARERLRLLGLTDAQIAAVETQAESAKADHVTLYAPVGGIVIEKHARQGSYVKEGDRIYTIADLSEVWVVLEAYESDLPWLRFGQTVRFTTEAFGDEVFEGLVSFIDPILDPRKRTVRVRVNAPNPDGRLRPGMFVRAAVLAKVAQAGQVMAPQLAGKWVSPMHPEVVRDEPGPCPVCGMDLVPAESLGYAAVSETSAKPPLVVPTSAVLRTGQRGIVYVRTATESADSDGEVFEGRQVELGPRGDGFFIVRSGLREGEQVVVRGNFQIDSALQIQAQPSMMNPRGGTTATGHEHHTGTPTTSPSPTPTAPQVHLQGETAAAMRELLDIYLPLSQALADDNLVEATKARDLIRQALQQVDQARKPDKAEDIWNTQVQQLRKAADQLADAETIEAMRVGFETFSNAMIALTQTFHIEGVGELYRAYCPMAFDNQGASWLTAKREILNPYFGDRMLRCGSIEQTLSTGNASGHDHE